MTVYTYNNIVKFFNQIADAHYNIKHFGHGFIDSIFSNVQKNCNYPLLWVAPGQNVLNENTSVFKIRLLVGDLVREGEQNSQEVLSDTLQILHDIIKILRNEDLAISVLGNPSLEPMMEQYMDQLWGWGSELEIEVNFPNNYCDIPSDVFGSGGTLAVDPETNLPYLTCASLVNCDTITGIEDELANHETRIEALENNPGGLTCDDLEACAYIITLTNAITFLGERVDSVETSITELTDYVDSIAETIMIPIDGYSTDTNIGTVDLYVGRIFSTPAATIWQDGRSISSPFVGTLVGAMAEFSNSAGSNEATTISVRMNNTDDIQITNAADFSQVFHVYRNMSLSQSVGLTDRFQLKIHGRTRVSAANSCRATVRLFFKQTL